MGMLRSVLLWASENAWMRNEIPKLGFVKKAVRRFMPGEDMEDALHAAERIKAQGMGTIFTYLGENVTNPAEADFVKSHYTELLKRIAQQNLNTEISLKLTQLGLDISFEKAFQQFSEIAEYAGQLKNFVWIDMESSAYTDTTLDFYKSAKQKHSNVGICLQAYLYRTRDDLQALLPLRPAIRLVKGAYKEPAQIAFPRKRQVDRNYLELARQMVTATAEGILRSAFATHDLQLLENIKILAEEKGLRKDQLEIQMLYGIKAAEQVRLAQEGIDVRVLISYGVAWYPWYMRRLAERPANLLFVLKNIV